ncbi:hypothetical protein BV25DRAFT_1922153 [Artomyces pyxidatus]|uniref:Uncharacterized protein n=1 Tax=Artomyces pyxidatus TaxID=48021 RepID=A0ACB8SGH6_9AGAM|nr:hypothetical protein BV25DRAFT_1922153 [Artomyces pyxidatus]
MVRVVVDAIAEEIQHLAETVGSIKLSFEPRTPAPSARVGASPAEPTEGTSRSSRLPLNATYGIGPSSPLAPSPLARERRGGSTEQTGPVWVVFAGLQPGIYFTEEEKNLAVAGIDDRNRWWELFDDVKEARTAFSEARRYGELKVVLASPAESSRTPAEAHSSAGAPVVPSSSAAPAEPVDQSQASPQAPTTEAGPTQVNGGNRNRNVAWVVFRGRKPGIYRTWDEAQMQLCGVSEASHSVFRSWDVAQAVYANARRNGRVEAVP